MNKICDWCGHPRLAVTYVDFQGAASQLQFCSDICLNEYKMHIFCNETRAHLEMHPHLLADSDSSSESLITPDLWFTNTKSLCPVDDKNLDSLNIFKVISEENKKSSSVTLVNTVPASSFLLHQNQTKKNGCKINQKNKQKYLPIKISKEDNSSQAGVPQDLSIRKLSAEETSSISETMINTKHKSNNISTETCKLNNEKSLDDNNQKQNCCANTILKNLLPPPTVFVPYPVILPLPVAIPIPIPIPREIKICNDKHLVELKTVSTQTKSIKKAVHKKKIIKMRRLSKDHKRH